MSEYGYIPEAPEQSFGNNKGIFTPKDIYDLTRADKYTNYGQLELIETQTYSSAVSSVQFTNIKEDIYNVHFMTINNAILSGDNVSSRLSTNGGSSYVSSGYQVASQNGNASGTFGESRTTSEVHLNVIGASSSNPQNAYVYYYNLGDSTKYSFQTLQGTIDDDGTYFMRFGSGVYPQANVVNAIQVLSPASVNFSSFDISLYGIKEYS
jgi:hypothetical protein